MMMDFNRKNAISIVFSTVLFYFVFPAYGQLHADFVIEDSAAYVKPIMELNPGEVEEKKSKGNKKEKKRKKNIFHGIKSKKRVTKVVKGKTITYEHFYVLKSYRKPSQFVDKIYYYNEEKRRIEYTTPEKYEPDFGMPLHGSYKKYKQGAIIEQGGFYLGTKDIRWEKFDMNGNLVDKTKWYKGFPKEAKIVYFDQEQKKIKEVIPYHHGEKHGTYLLYYPSGKIKERGIYVHNKKIKIWMEYYDRGGRQNRMRETVYPNNPFKYDKPPLVRREWDKSGKKTLDLRPK